MKILDMDTKAFARVRYRTASRSGERDARLSFFRARVNRLPPGVDGVLAAADLQGREPAANGKQRHRRLLGEYLAERLGGKGILRRRLPAGDRLGVVLAGDMYARPNLSRMGGKGEVSHVWQALARRNRWVTGVLGNHDEYCGGEPEGRLSDQLDGGGPTHLLNGETVSVDGLLLGGVGGSVRAPNRGSSDEERYLGRVATVLERKPELLLLHHGPSLQPGRDQGLVRLREMLEQAPPLLVIYGHRPSEMLHELPSGTQLLNVQERAVLLTR